MRVIAGEFRSRVLRAPRGWDTRPTSDRLRETLFNVLGDEVVGVRFLDLYAGSGANGLEALSRGAREAVFVERAAPALAAIHANVAALKVEARARVVATPVRRWLARVEEPFDIIFLDPPYGLTDEYAAALEALGRSAAFLAQEGLVVAEHRRGQASSLAGQYGCLRRTRVLEQGDAALSFFRGTGGNDSVAQV